MYLGVRCRLFVSFCFHFFEKSEMFLEVVDRLGDRGSKDARVPVVLGYGVLSCGCWFVRRGCGDRGYDDAGGGASGWCRSLHWCAEVVGCREPLSISWFPVGRLPL